MTNNSKDANLNQEKGPTFRIATLEEHKAMAEQGSVLTFRPNFPRRSSKLQAENKSVEDGTEKS